MTKQEIKTMTGKTAKEVELFGMTFYAIREKFGYTGSECFGAYTTTCTKFGWSLFNSKGVFIFGGIGSIGMTIPTFAKLAENLKYDSDFNEEGMIKFNAKELSTDCKPFEC